MPGPGGMVRSRPRRPLGALTVFALMLALGGCVLPGGGGEGAADTPSITGPAVETTTLPPDGATTDAASSVYGPERAVNPEPPPEAAPPAEPSVEPVAETAPEPEPPVVKSPAQIACEKQGGRLVRVGTGLAMACQRVMRDAGKSCRRKSDCEGECLARSGTCAPLAPLFGCNDVLQDDGRQVSLCID